MKAKFENIRPEERPITKIQSQRLASLTDIDAKNIVGQSLVNLSEKLRWQIDPSLLLFRKICGRVVKKDPVTGVEYGVPFATVFVEDTDSTFLSYFPSGSPYVWHYPTVSRREVIGSTKTDACGNFCVYVPRFDIDWILRWRKERVCYPIIFERPYIGDLLPKPPTPVEIPWPPIPKPDLGPWQRLTTRTRSYIEAAGGSEAVRISDESSRLLASQTIGSSTRGADALEDRRVNAVELPPPLPAEFHKVLSGVGAVIGKNALPIEGIHAAIAAKVGLDLKSEFMARFNLQRFVGPFWRCRDVFVPEWQLTLDVPDITFRVTQDTNGDGTEETIYSEGYFDVRWNAGALPNVTLQASGIAKESRFCSNGNPPIRCGTVPAILTVGLMTVTDASYFNATDGYALRPNRPVPTSGSRPAAQTPFCGSLQLYGCVDIAGAKFYRLRQSMDDGLNFTPITGLGWNNYSSSDGHPIPITADANGWYPVNPIDPVTGLPVARTGLEFPNLLLDWPAPNGKHLVKIQLADAAKTPTTESVSVAIQADNTAPTVDFNPLNWLAWKFAGEPDSALRVLGKDCPVIPRGAVPRDIEVVFRVNASGSHFRDAGLYTSGCGSGSHFVAIADPLNRPSHWHASVWDTNADLYQRYQLSGLGAKPGCYSFGCAANSRAINPSGGQGENLIPTPDWYSDPIYIHTSPSLSVAVVNEN